MLLFAESDDGKMKGISEIAGLGKTVRGAQVKLYRALRVLLCEKCGGEIKEGELFTRWPVEGQALLIIPRCRACVPFEPEAGRGEKRSASLMKELLRPESAPKVSGQRRTRQELEQAIEKRLGRALRWSRRRDG